MKNGVGVLKGYGLGKWLRKTEDGPYTPKAYHPLERNFSWRKMPYVREVSRTPDLSLEIVSSMKAISTVASPTPTCSQTRLEYRR